MPKASDREIPTDPGTGLISVAIGRWAVASAPAQLRTLLGSCVGVAFHDREGRLGALTHVVLPTSRGIEVDHPGKYADTAIPAVLAELERRGGPRVRSRLTAKLAGGARMFQVAADTSGALDIGRRNQEAIEAILAELRIPVLARDFGGNAGRRLTLDTVSGIVAIKVPGGAEYSL